MRRKKVCFVGYGSTEYSRKSEESLLGQYAIAIRAALNQTGLKKKDINGLSVTTQASPDTAPHVAEQLGFELDWVLNADYGGASGVGAVSRAADAIECGHLDIALLLAGNSFDRSVAHQRQLEYQRGNFVDVYGYGGPNSLMALIQRLHMENFGTTLEQVGKIAVAQRFNAINNPQALFREPMSMQDYLNSRMISDPVRLFDCVMPCSGAECIILASEEKAKQLTDKLVYLVTDAEKVHYQVANMLPEKTTFGMKLVGEKIFSEVKREDIDLFEIYDDYPIAVMIQIEDFGYCKKGDGGKFVDAHDLTYKGDFPVNTGGGELSVGQAGLAGGFLHVVEALRQLRGEADGHQVAKAERALVTGIGWLNYGRNLGTTSCAGHGKEKVMAEARAPQKSLPKINPVDRPFWEGARNNKFLLQKCKSCGKVQFFPRVACVDCFGEVDLVRSQRHRQDSQLHAGARAAQPGVQRRSADLLHQRDSRRRRHHRKPPARRQQGKGQDGRPGQGALRTDAQSGDQAAVL